MRQDKCELTGTMQAAVPVANISSSLPLLKNVSFLGLKVFLPPDHVEDVGHGQLPLDDAEVVVRHPSKLHHAGPSHLTKVYQPCYSYISEMKWKQETAEAPK